MTIYQRMVYLVNIKFLIRSSVLGQIVVMVLAICLMSGCFDRSQATYTYSTDSEIIYQGNLLFDNYCAPCHNFKTEGMGPNLAGITRAVSSEWLIDFIRHPMEMIESGDKRAVALYDRYKVSMPGFEMLSENELDAVLAFLHTHKELPETIIRSDWGEPVTDPVSEKIPFSDLRLTVQEFIQMPPTAEKGQRARINKMAPVSSKNKRLFVHDLRGKLYELHNGQSQLFLDLSASRSFFIHEPGHGTGMGSFAFHPGYDKNGLFYTTHTEDPTTSPPADFSYPDSLPIKVRWVLTEWKQQRPEERVFSGTSRELMRVDMVSRGHGFQDIAFRPFALPGEEDYGLLYIGVGDGGSAGQRLSFLTQSKSRIWGNILRIDPQGINSSNGRYGIPMSNPFVGEIDVLGEIYAMGFRNPHRFTWDEGRMLSTCIGQHFLEEVNLVRKGANYGWPEREGTFRIDKSGSLRTIYPLPANDSMFEFTYPVAQFDHDEAIAISGGYVYRGNAIPELKGKYLFGGIVSGRIFVADASTFQHGTQTPIEEIVLQLEDGQPVFWPELTGNVLTGHGRVDLRFGMDGEGELYIMTKADGMIYKLLSSASLEDRDI